MPPKSRKGKKGKSKARLEEEEQIKKQTADEVIERFQVLYSIYDQDDAGSIPAADFGNFVRTLGIYATNQQIEELAQQCKDEEDPEYFANTKLETVLMPILVESILDPTSPYAPPSEDELISALKSLDTEHQGHLTEGEFRKILSSNGDKLTPDELNAAWDEANDPTKGVVNFERYAGRLLYNSKVFSK